MPSQFLDEPVELIYEDMDGYPCVCDAIYTDNRENPMFNKPFFKREADGVRMMNCIAWRYRPKEGRVNAV